MISVIIPLYNKEKSIGKTIESVLTQTYQNFEVIIIDDGSTDNSLKIANSISDERLFVFHKTNAGVSSARNYGAVKASREWLFFLDADDLLTRDSLQTLIELSHRYTSATMLVSNFKIIETDKNIDKNYSNFNIEGIVRNPFKSIWNFELLPRTGNMLIKTAIFRNSNGFREDCSVYEDLEFLLNILYDVRLAYTPKVLLTYLRDFSDLSVNVKPFVKTLPFHIQSFNQINFYHRLLLMELCYRTLKKRKSIGDLDAVINLENKL